MTEYQKFVTGKIKAPAIYGHEPGPIHPMLFDFQQAIVKWSIRRGRAAVFADCGLGKSLMQLEWARQSVRISPIAAYEKLWELWTGAIDREKAKKKEVG